MASTTVNSAHTEGLTCLAFSKSGSHAFTGGSDSLVRIWRTDQGSDQEPEVAMDAADGITSISSAHDCWLSGSEDGVVRLHAKDKVDLKTPISNINPTPVPIRCVAVDPKGVRVAVTSDNPSVKVFPLNDLTEITNLAGHEGPVRRATWHPSGTRLSTCGSDGKIFIWDVSEKDGKEEKVIDDIIPAVQEDSPEFLYDCSALWHPSGQYFFVVSRTHEIVTVSRSTWTKASTFTDNSVAGPVTSIALSSNGLYLASTSRSTVYIWDTRTLQLINQQPGEPQSAVTQLAWSPTQNLLAWTDHSGTLTRWARPAPADPIQQQIPARRAQSPPLFSKKEDMDLAMGGDIDIGEDTEDWIVDDLGTMGYEEVGKNAPVKEMVSITKAQPPFQPGSTPMENKKRYLAFNMIGVIGVTDQDTHHVVTLEFHDQSARKGYHFTDHKKYDLGYLGERGALFACQQEKEHPAQVYFKPYTSWTSQGEWTYTFPVSPDPDFKILAVAAGSLPPSESLRRNANDDLQGFGDVVVATSEGDLTFLSGTGRERRIMGLGSEVVTMVAGAEWVFVVHRAGGTTIDGSQNLSYSIINFDDFTVRQKDVLPIPKGHVLKWIGLTAEGAPAMYDSTKRVHVLTKFRIPHHASWARILDTNTLERREGKDESYWPVGITGSTFMCLILKGRQEYPAFPRPLIQELPVRMPFRNNNSTESPLEERTARDTLLLELARDSLGETLTTEEISKREIEMDKELIQLIQAACKADNIPRAIELTKLLHHTISLGMASKVAAFNHLIGLQEKIETLKTLREEEEEDRLLRAREKRRQWLVPDPLPRALPNIPAPTRQDPLQDFVPPPPIYRPGLARAIPVVETTRYPSTNHHQAAGVVDSPPAEDTFADHESVTPDGKRKRMDHNELYADDGDHAKKRVIDEPVVTSAASKPNPFAKKPGLENGRNPFARKTDVNKTIQKSESFFDKVNAAEITKAKGSLTKGKEKAKKEVPRLQQSTLFGLPAPEQHAEKKARGRKKDNVSAEANDITVESQSSELGAGVVSETLVESQTAENQTTTTSQTQTILNSQTQSYIDSQEKGLGANENESIDDTNPETIEWPPSPQAALAEEVVNR